MQLIIVNKSGRDIEINKYFSVGSWDINSDLRWEVQIQNNDDYKVLEPENIPLNYDFLRSPDSTIVFKNKSTVMYWVSLNMTHGYLQTGHYRVRFAYRTSVKKLEYCESQWFYFRCDRDLAPKNIRKNYL